MKTEEWLRQVEHLFRQSIFEVMEKMYFIFLEPASKEGEVEPEWYAIEVGFSGAWQGKITVHFSLPIVSVMMENVLGSPAAEGEEQLMEDTMKECVNMIAGNFLRKFEPEKALYLTIPRNLGKTGPWKEGGDIVITLGTEGASMVGGLTISPAA